MPIFHNYKTIFVHIPKTAGTSIEYLLGFKERDINILRTGWENSVKIGGCIYVPQHLTSRHLMDHPTSQNYWDEYYTFSVVRNPYDRILSEYYGHVLRDNKKKFSNNEFKKWFLDKVIKQESCHYIPQSNFIIEDGEVLVEDVFKFESLQSEINILKKKLNIKEELPHKNKSNNNNKIIILNKENKNIIYDLYREDFINFNYEK